MIYLLIHLSISLSDATNLPHNNTSPVVYYQCVSVVRMIEHQIRKYENPYRHQAYHSLENHHTKINKQLTKTKIATISTDPNLILNIIRTLSNSCNELTDTRKNICNEILTEKTVQKVYTLIKEGQKANQICASIGYQRSSSPISRTIDKKFCFQVIDLIKTNINKSSSLDNWRLHQPKIKPVSNEEQPIDSKLNDRSRLHSNFNQRRSNFFQNRRVSNACKQFIQTSIYQKCLIVSRIAMNEAFSLIQSNNSSESICNYLESKKIIQFTDKESLK